MAEPNQTLRTTERRAKAPQGLSQDDRADLFLADNGARLLRLLTDKESIFTERDIQRTLTRIGDWDISGSGLDPAANPGFADTVGRHLMRDGTMVISYTDESVGRRYFTTPEMLELERDLMETARGWTEPSVEPLPQAVQDKAIEQFLAWNQERGYAVDPNIVPALRHMYGPDRLTMLDAPPGAGKSTAAKGLALAYAQTDHELVVVGPSDVITAELVKEVGADRGVPLPELISAIRVGKSPIAQGSAIIVDEAGMIGSRDMALLFQEVEAKGARLHLIGDTRQIQPEKAGQPFRVFTEHFDHPSLTSTFRQKKPEDRAVTLAIWNGQIADAVDTLEDRGSIHRREGMQGVMKAVSTQFADWYTRHLDDGRSGLVLTLGASDAAEANLRIRDRLKETRVLGPSRTYESDSGSLDLATNDRVILTADVVDTHGETPQRFAGGSTGRVIRTEAGRVEIRMDGQKDDSDPLTLRTDQALPLGHAFALDLRRVQGISVDQAFAAVTRRFQYGEALVALSRHKTNAIMVSDEQVYPDRDALKAHLTGMRHRDTAMDLLIDPRFKPEGGAAAAAMAPARPAQGGRGAGGGTGGMRP